MSNVFQFPVREASRKGSAADFTPYLLHLGAVGEDLPVLLDKLQGHLERVEIVFDLDLPHTFPAPLSEEQVESIGAALQAQATEISSRLKENNTKILMEFARLEVELLRKL